MPTAGPSDFGCGGVQIRFHCIGETILSLRCVTVMSPNVTHDSKRESRPSAGTPLKPA
jgi:hypothetical protein